MVEVVYADVVVGIIHEEIDIFLIFLIDDNQTIVVQTAVATNYAAYLSSSFEEISMTYVVISAMYIDRSDYLVMSILEIIFEILNSNNSVAANTEITLLNQNLDSKKEEFYCQSENVSFHHNYHTYCHIVPYHLAPNPSLYSE